MKKSGMRLNIFNKDSNAEENNEKKSDNFVTTIKDVVKEGFGTKARNVALTMKEGDIVVPLCSNIEMRQNLAGRGIYAGVEYEVCKINDGNLKAWIKPRYPLRDYLERDDWPVYVRPFDDVPLWLSSATYNAGTALGTLMLAATNLSIAAFLAYFVRFVYVPTESMIPALMPGDVVLVTRSIPIPPLQPHVGDVVFFNPPNELNQAIAESTIGQAGGAVETRGKQLLKRVVATPGDRVGVREYNPIINTKSSNKREVVVGSYAHPEIFSDKAWNRPISEKPLEGHEFFVAGDNGARSVDSRVWGPLKEKYVIGTGKWVVYPPEHFGPVKPGNIIDTS